MRALSCNIALEDWLLWKSEGALGTLRCLREVYWHQLISQGVFAGTGHCILKNCVRREGVMCELPLACLGLSRAV